MLGGMWTAGLLNPLFDPRKGWIVDRLIDSLQQREPGFAKAWTSSTSRS